MVRPVLTLATAGLFSAAAVAAPPDASALFEKGRALQAQDRLPEALEQYLAAFGVEPRPEFQCQIGRVYQRLDRLVEARKAYDVCITAFEHQTPAPAFLASVRGWRDDVVHALSGALAVINGPGVRAFVGTRLIGTVPFDPVTLEPGAYVVRLVQRDGTEREVPVSVSTGQTTSIDVEAAFRRQSARLRVVGALPGDVVAIDDVPTADTADGVEVSPGEHHVAVRREGAPPFEARIRTEPGAESTVAVVLGEDAGVNPWPWSLVGVGGAALVTGLVFTLVANRQYDEYTESPVDKAHLRESAQDNDTVAYSLYGVGGALFAAGLTWGLVDLYGGGGGGDSGAVSLAPVEGGALLQVRGGF